MVHKLNEQERNEKERKALFLQKLSRKPILKGTPNIQAKAQNQNQQQQQPRGQKNLQLPLHNGPMDTSLAPAAAEHHRSSSASPKSDRRVGNQHLLCAGNGGGLGFKPQTPSSSLNVPMISRKLSLQPLSQQQHQAILTTNNMIINNSNGNLATSQYSSNGSITNLSVNNLAVSNIHLTPRKSVIGRLERTSFQTQRLSDVGIAFGQQITAKMGLKLPASQERIVEQTRWLYLRYVFVKLRQNSLPLRDLNLTKSSRARRAAALGEAPTVSISAPATASTDQQRAPSLGMLSRKRTTMTGNLDTRELNFLAARMQTMNLKNDESPSINESNYTKGSHSTTNSDGKETSTNNHLNNGITNKKYIMDPTINNQIFAVIQKVIRELRELKPELYGDTIYELIGIDKFSSIQSLLDIQMTICQEMTRTEITWCRIIALFSLFGAMSLDCVRLGTPEHVGPILDGFIEFVERDLALWISQQGGWESFLYKHRTGYNFWHLTTRVLTTIISAIFVWIVMTMFYWDT